MDLMNDRKKELAEIEELFKIKINLRIDEAASLDTFYIESKRNKTKNNALALSAIDRTYYFSDEKKKGKRNNLEVNEVPAVNLELKKSPISKVFANIIKKFKI